MQLCQPVPAGLAAHKRMVLPLQLSALLMAGSPNCTLQLLAFLVKERLMLTVGCSPMSPCACGHPTSWRDTANYRAIAVAEPNHAAICQHPKPMSAGVHSMNCEPPARRASGLPCQWFISHLACSTSASASVSGDRNYTSASWTLMALLTTCRGLCCGNPAALGPPWKDAGCHPQPLFQLRLRSGYRVGGDLLCCHTLRVTGLPAQPETL